MGYQNKEARGSCGESENRAKVWGWHWDTEKEIPGGKMCGSLPERGSETVHGWAFPCPRIGVWGWAPLHRLGMRLTHLLSLVTLGLYSSRTFPSPATGPSMTLHLFQVFLKICLVEFLCYAPHLWMGMSNAASRGKASKAQACSEGDLLPGSP